MKRRFAIAAALCMTLFCLSGCTDQSKKEQSQQNGSVSATYPHVTASDSDLKVYDEAPASSSDLTAYAPAAEAEPTADSDDGEDEPSDSQELTHIPHEIPSGVWLAGTDAGYSSYYHFDAEAQSGSYVSLDSGLGLPFSYDNSSEELVFVMGDLSLQTAAVEAASEEEFTLVWENGLPETLTYVCEGTLEDFHFYTNDELCRMAEEYYVTANEDRPDERAAMTNEDNTVTVQFYDNLGDHNSTSAWYVVDRFTAAGTDLTSGESVDLRSIPTEIPGEDAAEAPEEAPAEPLDEGVNEETEQA